MTELIVNPFRCFNCHGAHNKIGEVRRCYGRFVTRGLDFISIDGLSQLDIAYLNFAATDLIQRRR